MKAYTKFKQWITISSLALVVSTAPVWAQDDPQSDTRRGSQGIDQSSEVQVNQPAQAPDSPSYLPNRTDDMSRSGQVMDEPAGADNATNWSWLGLLGLLGLFGLKRTHEAHDERYRPART